MKKLLTQLLFFTLIITAFMSIGISGNVKSGALGELLFQGNMGNPGNFGLFYYNDTIYVSDWNTANSGNEWGKLYRYKKQGSGIIPAGTIVVKNLPEIGFGANFENFATDGTYIYAVNETPQVFVIDPVTMSFVKTIQINTNELTNYSAFAIAYDVKKDGFWINFREAPSYFMSKEGEVDKTQILSIGSEGTNGLTYDETNVDGACLWFSHIAQGTGDHEGESETFIGRFLLDNGNEYNGVMVMSDFFGTGTSLNTLYIYIDKNTGYRVLLGTEATYNLLFAFNLGFPYDLSGTLPDAVEDFTVIPSAIPTELLVEINWKNPVKSINKQALGAPLSEIRIYRNNVLIHTESNPVGGDAKTWRDESLTASGFYTYKIVAVNADGEEGLHKELSVSVGEDVPRQVTNLQAQKVNNNTITLTWVAPTRGVNGGWIDAANLKYKIVRKPDNVVVADNHTGNTFTDATISQLNVYSYEVISKNTTGLGKSNTSKGIKMGEYKIIPWHETFETEDLLSLWTIIKGANTSNTWMWDRYRYNTEIQQLGIVEVWTNDNAQNDDWLISPPVALEAGKNYILKWTDVSAPIDNTKEEYTVNLGLANNAAEMTTQIGSYVATEPGGIKREEVFTVNTSGNYYFGWHCISDPLMAFLMIDEIEASEMPAVDIALTKTESPRMASSVGKEVAFRVTVKNEGLDDIASYRIDLLKGVGNRTVVASATVSNALKSRKDTAIVLKYIPSVPDIDMYQCVVVATGDVNTSNDSGTVASLQIDPSGMERVMIGDHFLTGVGSFTQLIPWNFLYNKSASQSLYYEEEINKKGLINYIEYYYSFESTDILKRPVKIYMAVTQEKELLNWLSVDTVLVFEGELDFPQSEYGKASTIRIDLQKPFLYPGKGNIMVFTQKDHSRYYINPSNLFYSSYPPEDNKYPRRNKVYANESVPFNFNVTGHNWDNIVDITFGMDTYGASVSGTVTEGETQIEGVRLALDGTSWTAVSDTSGKYDFPFLPSGTYTIQISKPGYVSQTQTITLANQPLIKDISLTALPKIKVSGAIKNGSGAGIENANVLFNGDEVFQTATDADGSFEIQNVYGNEHYALSVYATGYKAKKYSMSFVAKDSVIDDITLDDCTVQPVRNLAYEAHFPNWYTVKLQWNMPQGATASDIEGYNIYLNGALRNMSPVADTFYMEKLAIGTYKYEVSAIFNTGCESPRMSVSVEITQSPCETPITDFPYQEGFESGSLDYCMEQIFYYHKEPWFIAKAGENGEGNPAEPHSGNFNLRTYGKTSSVGTTLFALPMMDITSLSAPVLSFWQARGQRSFSYDNLYVYYKNKPDGDWTLLKEYRDNQDLWGQKVIDLPNPTSTYWIGFESNLFAGPGILLDDIAVLEKETCPAVSNLKIEKAENGVRLTWDIDNTDVKSYTIRRGGNFFVEGSVIAEGITATEYLDSNASSARTRYCVTAVYDKISCVSSTPACEYSSLSNEGLEKYICEIFPNPAKTELTVRAKNITKIELFDIEGRLIETVFCNGADEKVLNVAKYKAGKYLLSIYMPHGKDTKTVIITK
jgi:hypothetical protein